MALTVTALTPNPTSGNIPGIGFAAIVQVAFDSSYIITGEVLDLSGIFPTMVFGGCVINDTLNDGGWMMKYVRATSGAPATGVIQAFGQQTNAATTNGPLLNSLTAEDLSAVNGQYWIFFGY